MKISEIIEKAKHMDVIRLPDWKNEDGSEDGYLVDKEKNCLRDNKTGEKVNFSSDCLFSDKWKFGTPISKAIKVWITVNQERSNYYKIYTSKAECFCLGYETAMKENKK